ncbi:uncharacterized protein BDZ99DRAFT_462735 [Mytilinidion resinicola]|uniref:HCNGP-domain-containing protein n=1 Tax=Mytilinidion resinicola TaxID=574789 RepID=A0A6A6YNH6_9PEZI|nr:uncharacterized protein BDZ99DRAFT_462735 [Mytilinidion resinicola]KAF2810133.1 hypothetical protein BDZ99DRAFT_462735 [Mytilinidion resinicola]
MLGLNYASSDEEEEVAAPVKEQTQTKLTSQQASVNPSVALTHNATKSSGPALAPATQTKDGAGSEGPVVGPTLGPSATSPPADPVAEGDSAPLSPYSTSRLIIRNLTMPPIPNFDIPPSPPGSPRPGPTARFAQFLELKKRGVHFNERIEKTSALRNPSHLQKLMEFAGISETDQYASTLPEELAIPSKFPEWAYADQLVASQKEITKQREAEQARVQREAIEFVPASASGASSRAATPGGYLSRGSGAERVMAGLDREKPGPSLVQDRSKRKEYEHRGGRDEPRRRRFHSRSRSPRRRRSRPR